MATRRVAPRPANAEGHVSDAGHRAARAPDLPADWVRPVVSLLRPLVDDGRRPAKAAIGDTVSVEAEAFAEGHDVLTCDLLFRPESAPNWSSLPMAAQVNDIWLGEFPVTTMGQLPVCRLREGGSISDMAPRPACQNRRRSGCHARAVGRRRVDRCRGEEGDLHRAAPALPGGCRPLDRGEGRRRGHLRGGGQRHRRVDAHRARVLRHPRAVDGPVLRPGALHDVGGLHRGGRPGEGPFQYLVRDVPAFGLHRSGPPRHLRRRAGQVAVRGTHGIRHSLPAAHPSDRADRPQGSGRRDTCRRGGPGQPLGDRRRRRRPYGASTPTSARWRSSGSS